MHIRPATAADQIAINRIVKQARINPRDLNWERFIVAEENGALVSVGQVKQHSDGSRELASIATIPSHQQRGIASEIVRALIAREAGVLHLFCEAHNEAFYTRFGFRAIERAEMPPYFARRARIMGTIARLLGFRLVVMKREP